MTVFVVIAVAMALVALAFVCWPLLRPARAARIERRAANVSIFRDQFADLDADLARGTLSSEQYQEARSELERRLLDETASEQAAVPAEKRRRMVPALVLAIALPLAAALIYARLGEPDAMSLSIATTDGKQRSPEQVEQMVDQLAQRLQKQPDNAEGWFVLARSYYTMQKYNEAVVAFEKVVALVPEDANVLADYADALAMSRGRVIDGPPLALLERALKIDPTQWKALAMAGTAAFDRKDYAQAVDYWERLKAAQPSGSPLAQSIQSSIDEARSLGKLGAPAARPPQAAGGQPAAVTGKAPAAAAASASVSGVVTLSPALTGKAAPTDTVYVFARPGDGSRMPLAVLRAQVKDLPLKFSLDDSLAMSPEAKISAHAEVVIAARVSRGGGVTAQSGDLQGLTAPVKLGARDLTVTIDQVVP